mmetsp:Transcript_20878/g.67686  ORF Transcript_20878/g.67686 Transcript_20878/m.67686 type:complete len:206 (+) Transcript_20878:793-1410(+)
MLARAEPLVTPLQHLARRNEMHLRLLRRQDLVPVKPVLPAGAHARTERRPRKVRSVRGPISRSKRCSPVEAATVLYVAEREELHVRVDSRGCKQRQRWVRRHAVDNAAVGPLRVQQGARPLVPQEDVAAVAARRHVLPPIHKSALLGKGLLVDTSVVLGKDACHRRHTTIVDGAVQGRRRAIARVEQIEVGAAQIDQELPSLRIG